MKIKKIAALLSVLCTAGILTTACNSDSAPITSTPETTVPSTLKEEYNSTLESIDTGATEKLENGEVVWLSTWDINPINGKAMPTELELFKNQYRKAVDNGTVRRFTRYVPCG